MKKLLPVLLLIANLCISLRNWFVCNRLADSYHFSSLDLSLRLTESIHNDSGIPLVMVRVFHNKLIGMGFDIFREYISYIDPRFLVSLIGFGGLFLSGVGIYKLIEQRKSRLSYVVFPIIVLYPFLMILFPSSVPTTGFLVGYSFLFGFLGIYGILSQTLNKWIWLCLIGGLLLSLWWGSVYTPLSLAFCLK